MTTARRITGRVPSGPLTWRRGDEVAVFDVGGSPVRFVCSRAGDATNELQVEAFAHELLTLDASDESSVLEFCARVGIPLHPWRYDPGNVGLARLGDWREMSRTVETSDALRFKAESDGGSYALVCLDEAADALRCLCESAQGLQRELDKMADGADGPAWDGGAFNAAAAPASWIAAPWCGHGQSEAAPSYSVTNAIAIQVLNAIEMRGDWICCEECGTWFKFHRSRRNPHRGYYTGKARFCCDACSDRARKRRQRRIDHGL